MRYLYGVVFSLLFMAMVAGCGKDEKRDQEIQKAMDSGMKKESQMYEGVQKSIDNIEKGIQEKQQGDTKK
jgi:hypothetical protein